MISEYDCQAIELGIDFKKTRYSDCNFDGTKTGKEILDLALLMGADKQYY